jgi:hypothetical protein
MVWIRKDDNPSIMPWNMRYDPVVKQAEPGQGVLPDNYRPASAGDVPAGRNCLNCIHWEDGGMCHLWAARVEPDWYCNRWAPVDASMEEEMAKHGDHDQKSHGRRGGFSGPESDSSVFQQVMGKPEDGTGHLHQHYGEAADRRVHGRVPRCMAARPRAGVQGQRPKQVIRDYLRKHAKALGGSEKTYMGIWFNTGHPPVRV